MAATTGESDPGRNLAVKRILPPYIDKTFESSVTAREYATGWSAAFKKDVLLMALN